MLCGIVAAELRQSQNYICTFRISFYNQPFQNIDGVPYKNTDFLEFRYNATFNCFLVLPFKSAKKYYNFGNLNDFVVSEITFLLYAMYVFIVCLRCINFYRTSRA